jgi:hypothetical protein
VGVLLQWCFKDQKWWCVWEFGARVCAALCSVKAITHANAIIIIV